MNSYLLLSFSRIDAYIYSTELNDTIMKKVNVEQKKICALMPVMKKASIENKKICALMPVMKKA